MEVAGAVVVGNDGWLHGLISRKPGWSARIGSQRLLAEFGTAADHAVA
jgi:hypothetical protein